MKKKIIETKKELGNHLQTLRNRKGFSVYKVSKEGSIRIDQIQAIETGEKNYTIDSLLGYLKALNLDIEIKE